MPDRYPGYDVLNKRHSTSWNEQTRRVVDARLAVPRTPQFLSPTEFATLAAAAARIAPQPPGRAEVPTAALVDDKLHKNEGDGYRQPALPPLREAWRRGLAALEVEADAAHGKPFHALPPDAQDALLARMQHGELSHPVWGDMPPALFFKERFAHDIIAAHYAHPSLWSAIGWGGPASPRGYVRMAANRRDPWEAVEAQGPEDEARVRRENQRVR
jgi:hypothetical protein